MNALYAYMREHQRATLVVFSLLVAVGAVSYVVATFWTSSETFDDVQEGVTYVVNAFTVLLLWFAFENMHRIDRESKRIQDFGDTLHREILR